MKLKDIIKTEDQIKLNGYAIKNNLIEDIDINIIAHFGNCVSFEISCTNISPLCGYNNTKNLGFLLKAFYELFEISEEDGLQISQVKNIPCRLIFTGEGTWGDKCIGFGHFMKDKFVFTQDFIQIDE